jgi:hypothetical protein
LLMQQRTKRVIAIAIVSFVIFGLASAAAIVLLLLNVTHLETLGTVIDGVVAAGVAFIAATLVLIMMVLLLARALEIRVRA